MTVSLKPIIHCILPEKITGFAGIPHQNIAIACEFISASLVISPFYIKYPERVFRYLLLPFFWLLSIIPLSHHRRYKTCVFLLNSIMPTRNLLRMYQSLALFALFESNAFRQRLGKQNHQEQMENYKLEFERITSDG